MTPRDQQRRNRDGMGCTVCGSRVPAERIVLLARRDDLTFVRSDCPACGSTTLGFLMAADGTEPIEAPPNPDARPIAGDDILDMHAFLHAWQGDLASLVDGPRGGTR